MSFRLLLAGGHNNIWGGGVKSYPNATREINRRLSSLGSTTSSFNVTVPNDS